MIGNSYEEYNGTYRRAIPLMVLVFMGICVIISFLFLFDFFYDIFSDLPGELINFAFFLLIVPLLPIFLLYVVRYAAGRVSEEWGTAANMPEEYSRDKYILPNIKNDSEYNIYEYMDITGDFPNDDRNISFTRILLYPKILASIIPGKEGIFTKIGLDRVAYTLGVDRKTVIKYITEIMMYCRHFTAIFPPPNNDTVRIRIDNMAEFAVEFGIFMAIKTEKLMKT